MNSGLFGVHPKDFDQISVVDRWRSQRYGQCDRPRLFFEPVPIAGQDQPSQDLPIADGGCRKGWLIEMAERFGGQKGQRQRSQCAVVGADGVTAADLLCGHEDRGHRTPGCRLLSGGLHNAGRHDRHTAGGKASEDLASRDRCQPRA